MASVRGGARELEAQTSIKRGYLNLIHARDAISHQAVLADALKTSRDHTMYWYARPTPQQLVVMDR